MTSSTGNTSTSAALSSSSSSLNSGNNSSNLGTASSGVVAVILLSVALSLGLMGIFYVIRTRHLERRRRKRQQQRQLPAAAEATDSEATNKSEQASSIDSSSSSIATLDGIVSKRRVEYLIDEDVSNGRELNKLPAVSYLSSDQTPLDFHYVTEHVQCEPNIHVDTRLTGVHCCDCQGDCSDGDCACTRGAACSKYYDSMGRLAPDYSLESPELIRECNSACKCNRRACKNMVIQRGCRARLVLFRTKSRGWGVSTLEHLKRGTFVGVYSGELVSVMSSQRRDDDTYLFNLSNNPYATSTGGGGEKRKAQTGEEHETQPVEAEKLQQEHSAADAAAAECEPPPPQQQQQQQGQCSEEQRQVELVEEQCAEGSALVGDGEQSTVVTTSSGQESPACEDTAAHEDGEKQADAQAQQEQLEPEKQEEREEQQVVGEEQKPPTPRRTLDESNYVCDAKFYGNFTRFINHSCDPNVIGVRTYTVHQDDRFPYIAFFTNRDVPAGTELTLNYGDSYWLVKCKRDKVYCLCKTDKCRFNKKNLAATLAQYNQKRRG